jgi:hypothetical protein
MFFSYYGPRGDTKLIKIDHCISHRLRARDDRCLLQTGIGGELERRCGKSRDSSFALDCPVNLHAGLFLLSSVLLRVESFKILTALSVGKLHQLVEDFLQSLKATFVVRRWVGYKTVYTAVCSILVDETRISAD